MSGFLLIAIGLSAAAIAAILVPLLRARGTPAPRAEFDLGIYRDQLKEIARDLERGTLTQAEADTARTEIERRMLAAADEAEGAAPSDVQRGTGRRIALIVTAAIPIAAALLYGLTGRPGVPDMPFAARTAEIAEARARAEAEQRLRDQVPNVDEMVRRLAEKLKREPGDLKGWTMLGRSLMVLERYSEAAEAYRRAADLSGGTPETLSPLIEARIFAGGMAVDAETMTLARAVLKTDPADVKARYYLGLGKAQAGDVKGALQDWIDIAALSQPGAPWMGVVNEQIAAAAKASGIDPRTVAPSPGIPELAKKLAAERPPAPAASAPAPAASAPPGPGRADVEAASKMSPEERQAFIRSMVERLAERMKENPNDPEGWVRLAKAYEVLGEKDKAADARAKAEQARKGR